MLTEARAILLHPRDDVVIAMGALARGATLHTSNGAVSVARHIAAGHKVAIRPRDTGDPVRRYGKIIGVASSVIRPGDHVHVHNLRQPDLPVECDVLPEAPNVGKRAAPDVRYFDGYLRPDGRVGTRNYVAIISTVNCSASVCQQVKERFRDAAQDYPNVDGVIAITHKSGCGLASGAQDHETLERVLAGYASHPNVAGYVFVGLGCEVAQPLALAEKHQLRLPSGERAPIISIQQEGGVRRAVEAAAAVVARLLGIASGARRTQRPVSDLVLGTNCGGSDSYSGITSNPALGWAFDEIVRQGGTGLLGETTEVFGAEHILARRATNERVAQKLLDRIAWWHDHLRVHGADFGSNPSPGNAEGGITTILEKSLGAIAKSGTTPLVDVIDYAERVCDKGFIYMDTPAYDPVSVTGLVAGGANVMCFTTGRGSVFGCKPVPSIKLASNSELYRRMNDDMDIDCGVVLEGEPIEEVGRQIFEDVLAVASGKATKSELAGVGEHEFAPWVRGPVL